jgi:hypothetical protein
MKTLSQRPMINLIGLTYFSAAAVSLFASLAVTASMLIAERAPQSVQYWTITIAVSLFFIIAGLLLLGIGRHLSALGTLTHSMTDGDGALLKTRWRRLAYYLLLGGMLVLSFLLLATYAILARIDEGFAVFG